LQTEQAAALPDYHRIRLDPLTGQYGAEWEYTFRDPKMGELHGVDRVFVVNGQRYLIQWRTAVADWAAQTGNYDLVTKSFRPPKPTRLKPE